MKSTISFIISCMFISLLIGDVQGAKRVCHAQASGVMDDYTGPVQSCHASQCSAKSKFKVIDCKCVGYNATLHFCQCRCDRHN
ncbi:unnamed protein product [Brassica rapa subsp. trilocularis]